MENKEMVRKVRPVSSAAFVIALMAMTFVFGLVLIADQASAQGDAITQLANENMPGLALITVIAGGAAVFLKGIGARTRTILGVVALGGVGLIGLTVAGGFGGDGGGDGGEVPLVAWSVTFDAPPGGADIDSELLDSQGFVACDGGTPDLNGEVGLAQSTQTIYDNSTMRARLLSDSDDDVARTAVGFQEIDCILIAGRISLVGQRDLNGDGTNDAVGWGMRLVSLNNPTFRDSNQTTAPTLYKSGNAGWECAFFSEGSEWISAFGAQAQAQSTPTSGPWAYTGTHAGGGAAADTWVLACVFNTVDGSPAGYTIPTTIGNVEWSAQFAVGSPEDPHIATVEWVLQTRT